MHQILKSQQEMQGGLVDEAGIEKRDHPLALLVPCQMRQWEWPSDILPLCTDRSPFFSYSDSAIRSYLTFLQKYPEAYGRLGRFVRSKAKIAQPCPQRFVFHEAHIDISNTDLELDNFLLQLGFEPDHFSTLNPPEYTRCFTMRFEVPKQRNFRSLPIVDHMTYAMQKAEERIASSETGFAYSEIEFYTDEHKRSFKFKVPSVESLENFPFVRDEFRPASFRRTKKWDVHVKIPTHSKGIDFECASHDNMTRLRSLFLSSGFYEIESLSGNVIYTVQLVNGSVAKDVFSTLESWASLHGGIISIELEACRRFWRSSKIVHGNLFEAPIPHVVERASWTSSRR